MRCSKVKKMMFLYFENKLTPKEREKVINHLKGCAWCMAEYKNGEHILNVMRSNPSKQLPEKLHKSIMQEVHGLKGYDEEVKKETKQLFGRATKRIGLALASLLAVFVIIASIPFDVVKEKGLEGINYIQQITLNKSDDVQTNEDIMLLSSLDNVNNEENVEESTVDFESAKLTAIENETNDVYGEAVSTKMMYDLSSKETIARENASIDNYDIDSYDEEFSIVNNENVVITSKSLIKFKTNKIENDLDKVKQLVTSNYGTIISKKISYRNDDFRTAEIIINITEEDLANVKKELNDNFKVDLDDEKQIDNQEQIKENRKVLEELEQNKQSEEAKLTEKLDDAEKEVIKQSIANIDIAIAEIKEKIEAENNKICELTFLVDEVSETELSGVISFKSLMQIAGEKFKSGGQKFVRCLEDALLWISENIIALLFYIIVFIIVYNIFKIIINGFKD